MKNIYTFFLIAIFGIALSACEKTDEQKFNKADLVGTWHPTWSKGYVKDLLNPQFDEQWDAVPEETTDVTYKADGSGKINVTGGEVFTWVLNGNQLSLTATDGDVLIVKVLELSKNKLVIEETDKDYMGEYYSVDTFTKWTSLPC